MNVKLVYGAPCSGKSTYVQNNADIQDIIYDGDDILSVITTKKDHSVTESEIRFVASDIRYNLLESASNRKVETFWLIASYPTESVLKLIKDFQYEEIFINATMQECLKRLENDETRPDKEKWKEIIQKWFEEHSDSNNGGENKMDKKFWQFKNSDEKETELIFNGPISDEKWSGDEITQAMFRDELSKVKGNLTVWLNSPGGDCFSASQIYTMLRNHNGKVTVKIDGIAASAASVVAMAGDETLISPTGMIMIHNPMTIASGNKSDMEKAISVLEEVKESIINAYVRKTTLSRAKISRLMDEETWMNAEKALQLGFVNGILFDDKKSETPPAPEPEEEKESDKPENIQLMTFSVSRSRDSFMQKVSAHTDGVPIEQLEKRLNLLKY